MADNWYRETEKLVASYWHVKDKIARLEAIEKAILNNLDTLTQELEVVKAEPISISKYGICPPRAPLRKRDLADLLAQVEKQVDKLSAEIIARRNRLASIRARLQKARETVAPLEVVMVRLTEDERKVTEYRYINKWSYYSIAAQMNWSVSKIRYTHYKAICKVAEWLGKRERGREE